MIYKHQYFQLDTDSKKVFDENEKELVLTGNAYRMFCFLCEKRNANLTQIGEFLDFAKDYTENHLRQYRYKINTIIGKNIIEYKNGIYSLIGEVKEFDELVANNRNTDLLQSDHIKSRQEDNNSIKKMKFIKLPAVLISIMLLLSFLKLPYSFYVLLRIAVTGVAVYYAYVLYNFKKQDIWFWGLIMTGILFNPIIPVYLKNKSTWGIIDVIVAIFFVIFITKQNKNNGRKKSKFEK